MDSKIGCQIATLGIFGYFPASGTVGSILTLPCIYLLNQYTMYIQYSFLICFVLLAFMIISQALCTMSQPDPSEIILDEVVGMLITLVGFSYNPVSYMLGFILFRIFDIIKPFGITYVERLPGAYGVLLDDCVAGLYARLILWYLCP
jgi:phosphatidylglycerophosphatase A